MPITGTESMAVGSLITACSGLCGVILAKCRCIYKRDPEGNCNPACGFSDKPLNDHHEIDLFRETVDDCEVLIITKKS